MATSDYYFWLLAVQEKAVIRASCEGSHILNKNYWYYSSFMHARGDAHRGFLDLPVS